MADTYTVRLEKVRAAIDAVLEGGQAVGYDGQQMSMANLAQLRQLEKDYVAEAAKEKKAGARRRNRVTYGRPF